MPAPSILATDAASRASPPQIVQDTQAIIEAVETNPSAIGYIKKEDLVDSVKVVWRAD
ncbi:MAG: hypothetical protein MI867_05840 [Pseudomonadales bacterium]|nr:hypothetical protein [Pseudomonadales bacterium]